MTDHQSSIPIGVPYSVITYGLMTNLREHKLAWTLNNNLDLSLEKNKDLDFTESSRVRYISSLAYKNETMKFILVNNRMFDTKDNFYGKIFRSNPSIDYLIFIKNLVDNITFLSVKEQLKRVPQIDYCFEMDKKYLNEFDFVYKLID